MAKASKTARADKCPNCNAAVPALEHMQQQLSDLRQQIKRLDKQVQTDPLTGLFNFRHFSDALEHEIERTQRSANATGLIMLDLDHFKRVNDTYGHEVGNQVLVHIARLLQESIRKLDIPCRYGGEEFAIILPTTDLLTSAQVAERLRLLIASSPLPLNGSSIPLSASLGVDVFRYAGRQTREDFIQQVDALLYQAKGSGRNRVCAGNRKDLGQAATVSRAEKDALHGLFNDGDKKRDSDS